MRVQALVQERATDWAARLQSLGIVVAECTGDTDGGSALRGADLIATTPCDPTAHAVPRWMLHLRRRAAAPPVSFRARAPPAFAERNSTA